MKESEYTLKAQKELWYEFKFSNKTIWSNKPEYTTKQPRGLHKVNYNDLIKKIC